ncbi:MAG: transketolase [Kiritimatiellae bacterium]|nr:transketolase [Kiritimatiellia bacterium]
MHTNAETQDAVSGGVQTFARAPFDERAAEFRYVITDMICRAGSGHLGGALSLVEIIITLYDRIMNIRPDEPRWPERDRLVLSKGHAGPVLYAALAYKGFFPKRWLGTMNTDGTRLPSHVDMIQTPGIDMTAGSLGQGLSCACGIALAARRDGKSFTTYCIIGDGESNEGQIWEAALFAAHNRLDNLVVICDYNKLQIDGFTHDVLSLEPLAEKWRAFGWAVFETDGHDWDGIYRALTDAKAVPGKPAMVIAHTVKGKGNRAIENRPESHNVKVPDSEAYETYMSGLVARGFELPY